MSMPEHKELIKKTFNLIAEGYDRPALRFFPMAAELMAELLAPAEDHRILDVATGTGALSLALAAKVPQGQVDGIDISEGMLEVARNKAAGKGLENTRFMLMDMEDPSLEKDYYDLVTSNFGLFFSEDMVATLGILRDHAKIGGRVAFSTFHGDSFSPLVDIFFSHLERYGIEPPTLSWKRLGDQSKIEDVVKQAGLHDLQVHHRDISYYLSNADQWWDIIAYAGFRALLEQLSDPQRRIFRQELLPDIRDLATRDGIALKVMVSFAIARR